MEDSILCIEYIGRTLEVKLSALLGNNDRQTDQLTNGLAKISDPNCERIRIPSTCPYTLVCWYVCIYACI